MHSPLAFCIVFSFSSTGVSSPAFGSGFGALLVSPVAHAMCRESMALGEEGISYPHCPAMVAVEE
jgi:hypothetical protein